MLPDKSRFLVSPRRPRTYRRSSWRSRSQPMRHSLPADSPDGARRQLRTSSHHHRGFDNKNNDLSGVLNRSSPFGAHFSSILTDFAYQAPLRALTPLRVNAESSSAQKTAIHNILMLLSVSGQMLAAEGAIPRSREPPRRQQERRDRHP